MFTFSQGVDDLLLLPETLSERPWFKTIWGKVDEKSDISGKHSQVKKTTIKQQ